MIGIINYGLGNLFSIKSACAQVGMNGILVDEQKDLLNSDAIILPGVGAFNVAMDKIKKKKLNIFIKEFVKTNKPIIGICLGMQLFFDKSYENISTEGLGLIQGDVKFFNLSSSLNIGWYPIKKKRDEKILNSIKNLSHMYFVHSYYCDPKDKNNILSISNFSNIDFCSSIKFKNIYGFQFHPEKSGENGLKIYQNLKDLLY